MSNRAVRGAAASVLLLWVMLSQSTAVHGVCAPDPVVTQAGNGNSLLVSLSADGRFVAFDSSASDLVAGDTNGVPDVFVYDRLTCTIERASLNSNQIQGNGASHVARISGDGRFVVFQSLAGNLVVGQTDALGNGDIFVRDRQNGTTLNASSAPGDVLGNSHSAQPAISADGLVVAFVSQASNLVPGDTNAEHDLFVRFGGLTTRVSVSSTGQQGESPFNQGVIGRPALSADGRFVVFTSYQTNLAGPPDPNSANVFRHDRQTGETILVSVNMSGGPGGGLLNPAVSADGRYVAFESHGTTLVPGDTNSTSDIFVRDINAGVTSRVSIVNGGGQAGGTSTFPSISGDGRYVAFTYNGGDIVAGDTNFQTDIYVHDRQALVTKRVSTSAGGVQGNNTTQFGDISSNGLVVGYESASTNLVATNVNGTVFDIFAATWQTLPAPPLVNLATNGNFSSGTTQWSTFGLPDPSYIVSNVTSGVFQFYRVAGGGLPTQAVVLQSTTAQVNAFSPITVSFSLGNSDSVRKRLSVLLHDSNFSDLSVCTFWLAPNAALQTYVMRTHTTQAWSNLTAAFYAATEGSNGGFYRLDNVSIQIDPAGQADETQCDDPNAPAPGGVDGPELLMNGSFSNGTAGWSVFGKVTQQVAGGIFQFLRPSADPDPAGGILQSTGASATTGDILTAQFALGNSSGVRKRVTVLLHDLNFLDLSACTFWLPPGQPLSPYVMRTFATKAWANATISFYAATVGDQTWIELDDVSLRKTPTAAIDGTNCIEPVIGSVPSPTATAATIESTDPDPGFQAGAARRGRRAVLQSPEQGAGRHFGLVDAREDHWNLGRVDLRDATSVELELWSQHAGEFRGLVEGSPDGRHWVAITELPLVADGTWVRADLDAYAGQIIWLRVRLDWNRETNVHQAEWLIEDPALIVDGQVRRLIRGTAIVR